MGAKQDRYNRRKREERERGLRQQREAAEAQRIRMINNAAWMRDSSQAAAAANAAAKAAADKSDLAAAAAAAATADKNLPFPSDATYPNTSLTPQQNDAIKNALDSAKAAAAAKAVADAANADAAKAAAAVAADEAAASAAAAAEAKRRANSEPGIFPELQSVDPPVLIISACIFVVLGICYIAFKQLFDSTIIQLFADIVINPNTQLTIYQRMLGSKFVLFLLVFLTLTLTILFGVYKLILRGSPEHYSSVYACISVCFFTTVFITFLLLEFFPYLVNIFENTIGYLWICIRPISDINVFNDLFGQNIITTIEDKYEVSYKFLITLMSLYNMDTIIDDFSKPITDSDSLESTGDGMKNNNKFFIKNPITTEIKKQIANLCFIKYSSGHFVWIYFASLICTFTSIKAFSKYLI